MANNHPNPSPEFRRKLRFELRSSDRILLLRSPKTNASLVYRVLSGCFPSEQVWPEHERDILWAIHENGVNSLSQYRLLWTGYDYSIYRPFTRKPVFVTVLRDPIARVIAIYRSAMEDKNIQMHDLVRTNEMSIKEFVLHSKVQDEVVNRLTRQLIGSIQGDMGKLSPENMFELARLRLEEIPFFGISDRLQESLSLLSYVFGFQWHGEPYEETAEHIHAPLKELDEETLEVIRKTNQLDIRLYKQANRVFERRLEQMRYELAHPPERRYRKVRLRMPRQSFLALGRVLRAWGAAPLIGFIRRLVIPEGSSLERRYLQWRKRTFGW